MTLDTQRLTGALADRYRIERQLGMGGMATVYLAHDIKHDRKVAVKVLKPELAAVLGAERFVVEIKTTASLSHPHILPLFDSGTADGFLFYVMPYVEGETLRDKLNRETQFGVDEAVRITCDVADALDYAHRHGVIHRDIKPENILMHDGRPMVADFGIALAVSAAAGGRMTETGLSLGTPHYMSPEQATAEKEITARSDVYSLASVLFEMLTGTPPHTGASAQQIIMKIITEQAESVTKYRKSVPPQVAAAIAKALEKLPADRFVSAAEFAGALTGRVAVTSHLTAGGATTVGRAAPPRTIAIAAGIGAVALLGGWALGRSGSAAPSVEPVTFTVSTTSPTNGQGLGITPDGRMLLYSVVDSTGSTYILARDLGSLETRVVRETRNAFLAGYGRDKRSLIIAREQGSVLVPLDGSPAVELGAGSSFGQTQLADGRIVFSSFVGEGLFLRNAPGDSATVLTRPDTNRRELAHWNPVALPTGTGVLFSNFSTPTQSSVEVIDIATGTRTRIAADGAIGAKYSTTGHVLFWRRGTVFAVPFDARRLKVTGPEVPVLEDVAADASGALAHFHVSENGTLVYLRRSEYEENARVAWSDRAGRESPSGIREGKISDVTLSADGRRAVLTIVDRFPDLWVYDFARGSTARLTTAKASAFNPIWSPDGRDIYFTNESPAWDIYRVAADGSAPPEEIISSSPDKYPMSIAPNGMLWFREVGPGGTRVRVMDPVKKDAPRTVLEVGPSDFDGRLSADGNWFAYHMAATVAGTPEVYVLRADGTGRRQLSTSGGRRPRFTRGGREIVYGIGDSLMAVPFDPRSGAFGAGQLLFRDANPFTLRARSFGAEGDRVLVARTVRRPDAQPLTVVVNWHTELLRRMDK